MLNLVDLNKAWEQVKSPYSCDRPNCMDLLDSKTVSGVELVGITKFGRHRSKWKQCMEFLMAQDLPESLEILVSAMSAGPDLYDAVREAEVAGVFDKVPDTVFYGHDRSIPFTELAKVAHYKLEDIEHVSDRKDYFENSDLPGYVRVQKHILDRVRILEASDIRSVKGKFDIAFANIMNPPPLDIDKLLKPLARHAVWKSGALIAMSQQWENVAHDIYPIFDTSALSRLPADEWSLD